MKFARHPTVRAVLTPLLGTLLLAGCAATPPYQAPPQPADTAFLADPLPPSTVTANTHPAWWKALQSPALNALVDEALIASPTLAAAEAALKQAQEVYASQAGSTQLPQVNLGVGAQRQQISPSSQGLPGDTRAFSLYSASVGVQYHFDFGGGIDHRLHALAARTEIRQHEQAAARNSLVAQLVSTAVMRARLAAQLQTQQAILRTQEELLRLAEVRARLGQIASDEVSALLSQMQASRAGIPGLQKQLQQADHLLAILVGRTPAQGVPAFALHDFQLPRELPVAIPSEWARHRPDIQAAEASMRAAHAEMGVAYARQYPQLSLNASLGSQALTTSALFGGQAAVWGLMGQISQPLFNAGLPAERRAAQAALDAATANYQRVVLESLRNVADALRAVEHDAQTLDALSRSVDALQQRREVVQRQQQRGTVSLLQTLAADQQWLEASVGLDNARAQRLLDTVALNAALAGDPGTAHSPAGRAPAMPASAQP